ncbi:MAG TPA: RNA polymerase factor sigma-54 [Edaphobacter sp.]
MLLQPKLNLKVSQRQVLTPGLVQMVSVLALNKLELKEMINTEIIENPVLEEIEDTSISLDERSGLEGDRERSAEEVAAEGERAEKDPFDEIDFGNYFQEYLDPGYRTNTSFEEYDKPSFENFLSKPSTLSDHLMWQLGALTLNPDVRSAAELVIGNLNENGYLTATDEELAESLLQMEIASTPSEPIPFERGAQKSAVAESNGVELDISEIAAAVSEEDRKALLAIVREARSVVNHLDPVGVGARDLRECLLIQIEARRKEDTIMLRRRQAFAAENPDSEIAPEVDPQSLASRECIFTTATQIVENNLLLLQKKDLRELTKAVGCTPADTQSAVDLIRSLDPRPGQRYNHTETRLIEPDVAFVKRDDQFVVVVNEEDMPALRLNHNYRRMLQEKQTEKEVKEYVKERYKSAIQLLRNIEQRKNTIVRTCEVIVRRQTEFLERGVEALKPMMIKEVAEEIGVHPSTVSRAVANKYVHTPQGVYELRFFFSEGVNGPEGGDLPLVLLKRKVKKLIEDEDPRKPLTDDQLAAELQRQGIQVTRRTVAKYREDMQIPSTHQRRVR